MTALGVDFTDKRQVVGWESVKPKRSWKPLYLKQAEEKLDDAWDNYMMLTDVSPLPLHALEEAMDDVDACKKNLNRAYHVFNNDLADQDDDLDDIDEIPF